MPTILVVGPYRFFFYASDRDEPVHVHVERDKMVAKFWIDPSRLQSSGGFSRSELTKTQKLVEEHEIKIMEAWHGYFGS